ncbi:MAG: 4-(cytidine 5'-diphospho)-2-C-methyl-D-erythritol kinase [Oceanicaulis sp.]|uniref:4-(cytidine 5'-diphospho)-2-C-methyl-D-erythritol kinase n=1 Tax=Glycocaulis sp. TaxID=1969725 RepID=UPI0025C64618|nr:4-(cytidine 5'-diphospho)-2-C-methyl-D-erythritol kinase [Glycocaulis sp.]MCC5980863.1 4-(cytidine 5'-diphospho)-2-C-methyl-D-erythritol kinase [Oceanicaulis sp.]MCH8521697.1 4-(cytidine 5'-diphospho)-2-C-methyl-D-erythritol kinase [Glycocaulis sp.]
MSPARDGLAEPAPAKINLTLHCAAPRADGYHPLHSLVVFADWRDTLRAEPADTLSLSLEGPGADGLRDDPHNLVLKAAWALRAAADKPELGARLVLEKHLPVAAGLGGGSADAAAALRLLNRLWSLDFSLKQLAEIASVVGADVPACVWSRPLVMEGIGETITPLVAWPALHGVIVHPGVALSTADVFAAFDTQGPASKLAANALRPVAGTAEAAFGRILEGRNDLESAAMSLAPPVGEVLKTLGRLPGARLARMSGSGASCFALFDNAGEAEAAADTLCAQQPGWLVRPVVFGGALS